MGIVNATPDSFSDAVRPTRSSARSAHGARAGRRRAPTSSTSAASRAATPPRGRRRGGDRARRAARRARSRARASLVSVDTYKPAVARGGDAPRARRSSTTSAACATPRWPTLVRARPARRSCSCTRAPRRRRRCSTPALRRRGRRRRGVPARADGAGARARRRRRADRARPGPGLRQDAGADGRGAARARRGCARSGARCCWRSRARTSSARSPAARRASAWPARSPRCGVGVDAGAAILRVHDVAAAPTSSPCAPCCAATPRCPRFDAGDEDAEADPAPTG